MEIHEEIFEKARIIAREKLSDDALDALGEMCLAAFYELSHRLRAGIDVESIRPQFVRAAATLAVSFYLALEQDRVGSFAAGSVRIEKRACEDIREASHSLRKQAELMLTGYLDDSGFAFRAVRA